MKFAGAAPLLSLACGLGTLRTALVSGAALLAGFVGSADAAPRGYFSPYGWYGGYRGYYTYPSYAPSRRARAAPR